MLDLGEAFELTYRLGRFARIVRHGSPLAGQFAPQPIRPEWAESLGRDRSTSLSASERDLIRFSFSLRFRLAS